MPVLPRIKRESARKIAHARTFASVFSFAETLKCLFFKCFPSLGGACAPQRDRWRALFARLARRIERSRGTLECSHSRFDVNAKSVFRNRACRYVPASRGGREPGNIAKKRHRAARGAERTARVATFGAAAGARPRRSNRGTLFAGMPALLAGNPRRLEPRAACGRSLSEGG